MKHCPTMAGLALLALALASNPLSAEPLRAIATTPSGSVYLLDMATIRDRSDQSGPFREARIRTDNSRSPLRGPTAQIASDSLFRARCASGSYLVVWTDVTQRNGRMRLGNRSAPVRPYSQPAPASFEAELVREVCQA